MAEMSYDELDGEIWFNGEMLPWTEAKVHILTHGLHYASAVFEGLGTYRPIFVAFAALSLLAAPLTLAIRRPSPDQRGFGRAPTRSDTRGAGQDVPALAPGEERQ